MNILIGLFLILAAVLLLAFVLIPLFYDSVPDDVVQPGYLDEKLKRGEELDSEINKMFEEIRRDLDIVPPPPDGTENPNQPDSW